MWTSKRFKEIQCFQDKIPNPGTFNDILLALYQEVAELVDSTAWKPWKPLKIQVQDRDNAIREIVDIIFFLTRVCTELNISYKDLEEKYDWVMTNNRRRYNDS